MHQNSRALVFSDLDGTLLHHSTYTWNPAASALQRLRDAKIGLVLSTSKTAAEVIPIRDEIGFADWPAIIENGGGVLMPGSENADDDTAYQSLRNLLGTLPSGFTGFGDMTPDDVSARSGLSLENAVAAKKRQFSEPGIWTGSEEARTDFIAAAKDAGLFVQRGGRFLTLSFGGTKADRMTDLITRLTPNCTIALGDAPNDVEMLKHADIGVIVANPDSPGVPAMPEEKTGRIRRTSRTGPEGWADAMSDILNELSNNKKQMTHG